MLRPATNNSVLQQTKGTAAYAANLFGGVMAVIVLVSAVHAVLVGQASDWIRTADVLVVILITLLIPIAWVAGYLIAFAPALLVVCINRVLQSQQLVSDRVRYGLLYALAIGFSIPISAVVWSLSYDGWPFVWPVIITAVCWLSCRELMFSSRLTLREA
jgi:hypothetical protein